MEDSVKLGGFKVMIQRKENSDGRYRLPGNDPEPLQPRGPVLTPTQQELATAMERRLTGQSTRRCVPPYRPG